MDFHSITYYFDLPIMQVLQGSDSLFMDRFIYTLTQPWPWIPLYLMLILMVIKNNATLKQILLILGFAILTVSIADLVVNELVKPYFMRWRPTRDPVLKYTIDVFQNYRSGKYGFFSAHAANTMSVAMFFCLLVRSRLFTIAMISWSLLNGYTRIYLGVHYPSDVCVGFLWGALVASVSYCCFNYFNRKITPDKNFISTHYTSTGYAYRDIYNVILTLLLICIFALFRALFPI